MFIKECKCYNRGLKVADYTKAVPCLNQTQTNCLNDIYEKLFKYLDKNCTECPFECTKTSYTSTVTSARYDSTKMYGEIKNKKYKNITLQDVQKRLCSVLIYFDDLKCTKYIQVPKMYLGQLVSNIGGYLGLMVGASILTLIEIIDIMVSIIFAYIIGTRSKKIISIA